MICSFVSSVPESWAPIISAWSLELLGELSTRYAGRAHVSSGNWAVNVGKKVCVMEIEIDPNNVTTPKRNTDSILFLQV